MHRAWPDHYHGQSLASQTGLWATLARQKLPVGDVAWQLKPHLSGGVPALKPKVALTTATARNLMTSRSDRASLSDGAKYVPYIPEVVYGVRAKGLHGLCGNHRPV